MDSFTEWITSKFQHPFSLLFFLLGVILILLGLTTGFSVPVLQQLALDKDYRWTAIIIGMVFIILSIVVYYRPPKSSTQSSVGQELEGVPTELLKPFVARVNNLTEPQRRILSYIDREGAGHNLVSQDMLETKFNQYNKGEIYYRLEQLYLLGLVEKQRVGQTERGIERYTYRLSSAYRQQLGETIPGQPYERLSDP
jgi:hypothetical protein